MITLTIYGLDQYIVGRLSREMTHNLADLYEVSEDDINFIAPNNMVFHNGVEQTSWNALIRVHLPKKVMVLQDDAAKLIMDMIQGPTINVAVEFYYYSEDNRYEKINEDYPRFITDDNLVDVDEDYEETQYIEGDGKDEVFTGDIFKNFNGE
ncbi:MAG: DUF1904 family protein [Erysipelotrichaceae bacterium]|nr:DUF1904 family protein [Erysipelotrichaceae bacterium]